MPIALKQQRPGFHYSRLGGTRGASGIGEFDNSAIFVVPHCRFLDFRSGGLSRLQVTNDSAIYHPCQLWDLVNGQRCFRSPMGAAMAAVKRAKRETTENCMVKRCWVVVEGFRTRVGKVLTNYK